MAARPCTHRQISAVDLDTAPINHYVDAAVAAVVHALDRRDVLAADIDQLALLGVIERDILCQKRARAPREAIVASAARFWRGLALLAGRGRATSLMPPKDARRWRASLDAWPPTPLSLARFLHDCSACPPPLALTDMAFTAQHALAIETSPSATPPPLSSSPSSSSLSTTTVPTGSPPSSSAPTMTPHLGTSVDRASVNRADAVLEWLAADLDHRLNVRDSGTCCSTNGDDALVSSYDARAAAHVIWRGHDADNDVTLYILVDEATATPRAAARVMCTGSARRPSVAPVPDVAHGGRWSGAPLAMAFTGAAGPADARTVQVAFVDQPRRLRRAIQAAGGATFVMHVVRAAPGTLIRATERGRAVWAAFDLANALDGRRRCGHDTSIVAAARTIRRALAGAIERDEADEAAGRSTAGAFDVLAPPFWNAACLLGVGTSALTKATAIEAAVLASTAAQVALGPQ